MKRKKKEKRELRKKGDFVKLKGFKRKHIGYDAITVIGVCNSGTEVEILHSNYEIKELSNSLYTNIRSWKEVKKLEGHEEKRWKLIKSL